MKIVPEKTLTRKNYENQRKITKIVYPTTNKINTFAKSS